MGGHAPHLVGHLGPGEILDHAAAHWLGQRDALRRGLFPLVEALQGQQVGRNFGHGAISELGQRAGRRLGQGGIEPPVQLECIFPVAVNVEMDQTRMLSRGLPAPARAGEESKCDRPERRSHRRSWPGACQGPLLEPFFRGWVFQTPPARLLFAGFRAKVPPCLGVLQPSWLRVRNTL